MTFGEVNLTFLNLSKEKSLKWFAKGELSGLNYLVKLD
jgi:hypothetical protein